ncbi:hypothetical protein CesoFtcFv8_010883 [Champsocephalus esox]|uniref:Uncharacterized protein n=1 Tax=Champsocephalus esox TaxID=159716 RepID=A0AAN8C310_9TELE|nr:hypothetical protein CesoFtcFv8_010883 [Champsocephalus esox]
MARRQGVVSRRIARGRKSQMEWDKEVRSRGAEECLLRIPALPSRDSAARRLLMLPLCKGAEIGGHGGRGFQMFCCHSQVNALTRGPQEKLKVHKLHLFDVNGSLHNGFMIDNVKMQFDKLLKQRRH